MKPAWSLPHRRRMFWPQTVLLLTPWPLPHPPLYKKLHFVSLLRAPVYLLDGMLPDSWMIKWSQLDLQIHSAEFFFLIVFLSLSSHSRGCLPAVGVSQGPTFWLESSPHGPASPGQALLQFWLLPGGPSFCVEVMPPPPIPALVCESLSAVESLQIVSSVCLPTLSIVQVSSVLCRAPGLYPYLDGISI